MGIANIVGGGRKQAPSVKKAIVFIIEIPQKKQPIVPIITTVKKGTKRMVHLMSGLANIQKSKSILNHNKRKSMTIKIEDGIDDLTAIRLVKQVIEQGKISNNGNNYCYLTLFGDIFVETRQYRKSPCFRVYKK